MRWPKVSLWQCGCGAHFKAVCEINDEQPRRVSLLKCHLCGVPVEIDGAVVELFCQVDPHEWKSVTPPLNVEIRAA